MGTPHIVGIVGYPLHFTLSPTIFAAAFRRLQLPYVYLPFVVAPRHLKNLLRCMRLMDVEGLNVTSPYKTAVLPLCDRVTPTARRIGAVNTLVTERGKFVGHNTDAAGFLEALRSACGREPRGARATIFGAGGAARAVADALQRGGAARITIVNRTPRHAATLVRTVRAPRAKTAWRTHPWTAAAMRDVFPTTDLLIHATSQQWTPVAIARLPLRRLPAGALLIDLQYGVNATPLVLAARALDFQAVDGLPILVAQAAASFRLWTGRAMATDASLRGLRKSIISLRNESA